MEAKGPRHFVGCLFTSKRYGRNKDKPAEILKNTGPSVKALMMAIKDYNSKGSTGDRVDEIRMCQINSGLFAVPWPRTKEVIEGIEVDVQDSLLRREVVVYSLPPSK